MGVGGSDFGGRNRLGAGFWFWVVQVPVCGGSVVEVYGIHVGLEVGAAWFWMCETPVAWCDVSFVRLVFNTLGI